MPLASGRSRRTGRRPGRPPGASSTREQILDSARKLFARKGFDAVSVRAIAGEAGVDPALINHYFGDKEGLFRAVIELPVDPEDLTRRMFEGATPDEMPSRIVHTFLSVWEGPVTGRVMIALLRRAAADDTQARSIRSFATATILGPSAARLSHLPPDEARLRFSLIASHLVGTMMFRHVLAIQPLASLGREALADLLVPTVARYLHDDLPGPPTTDSTEGTPS